MKRIFCLLLVFIMAMSLWVPAFAVERDPKTDELYETFTFNFDLRGYRVSTVETENFLLEACVPSYTAVYGGNEHHYVKIWVKEGRKATITRIEARVSDFGFYWEQAGVTVGTKRENTSVNKGTWVHVDDINSSEFSFDGGTKYSEFDIIKVYYTCDEHYWGNDGYCELCGAFICDTNEHTWGDDGYCKYCGVFKCDVTGEHTWDVNGHCEYCEKFLCDETGEHMWKDNGHCQYCDVLKCDVTGEHMWKDNGHCQYCDVLKCNVTGEHDHITETKIPAYIVKNTCDYCGEIISEEVVEANNNTASIFGDGNVLIISSIICILLGLGGGYLLGTKKKAK